MKNFLTLIKVVTYHVLFRRLKLVKHTNCFRVTDGDGNSIHFPFLRRYLFYFNGVETRLNQVKERYFYRPQSNMLVLDIGAHIGEFTMVAARESKQVICFEPDPIVRDVLVLNTKMLNNVKIMPIGLSDQNKETEFFIATMHADSSFIKPSNYDSVINISSKRLDSIEINYVNFDYVLLKMDAEGFEPEVLLGASGILKHVDECVVDVSPERLGQSTLSEVKTILQNSGFKYVTLSQDMVLKMVKQ